MLLMPLFADTFIAVYTIALAFIFGTVFASFITCTAGRTLAGEDWTKGYSHCDTCGHQLGTLDLFPVLSWLFLKGRCRYCGAKVPIRCVLSEAFLGLLFVGLVISHGVIDGIMIRNLVLAVLLMGVSFCDIDGHVIPNGFTLAVLITWVITLPLIPGDLRLYTFEGLAGCAIVSVILLLVSSIIKAMKKTPAIGGGDLKLFAVLSLYTGIMGSLLTLILACVFGLIVAIIKKTNKIALAPAISIACVISLVVIDLGFI